MNYLYRCLLAFLFTAAFVLYATAFVIGIVYIHNTIEMPWALLFAALWVSLFLSPLFAVMPPFCDNDPTKQTEVRK